MPALVTITAQRCAAAWSCNVQELTVHNRTSTGWASPPDLMFLKCFTQQAPAGFSEKSVTSRRDLDHSRPPQLQRCKRIRIESLIDHCSFICSGFAVCSYVQCDPSGSRAGLIHVSKSLRPYFSQLCGESKELEMALSTSA